MDVDSQPSINYCDSIQRYWIDCCTIALLNDDSTVPFFSKDLDKYFSLMNVVIQFHLQYNSVLVRVSSVEPMMFLLLPVRNAVVGTSDVSTPGYHVSGSSPTTEGILYIQLYIFRFIEYNEPPNLNRILRHSTTSQQIS